MPDSRPRSTALLTWTAGLLLSACHVAKTEVVPLNPPPHPPTPRPASAVEMYTTSRPERRYVEVAMMETRVQNAMMASAYGAPQIVAELREEAGKAGCDALILTGSADQVVGDVTQSASTAASPCQVAGSPVVTQGSTTVTRQTTIGTRKRYGA